MTADLAATFRWRVTRWIAPFSEADQDLVLDWIDRALDTLERTIASDRKPIEVWLLLGCLQGDLEITGVRDGDVLFRTTPSGLRRAARWATPEGS